MCGCKAGPRPRRAVGLRERSGHGTANVIGELSPLHARGRADFDDAEGPSLPDIGEGAEEDEVDDVIGVQSGEPFTDEDLVGLVTWAKRRRILQAQRAEAWAEEENDSLVVRAAWGDVVKTLPGIASTADGNADDVAPFVIHPSHNCVHCGGFVGCMRCGTIVAARWQATISRPCRGYCLAGSKGPVQRLAQGVLPHDAAWPNGKTRP